MNRTKIDWEEGLNSSLESLKKIGYDVQSLEREFKTIDWSDEDKEEDFQNFRLKIAKFFEKDSDQLIDKIKEEIATKRAEFRKLKRKLTPTADEKDCNPFYEILTSEIKSILADTSDYRTITSVTQLHEYLENFQQFFENFKTAFLAPFKKIGYDIRSLEIELKKTDLINGESLQEFRSKIVEFFEKDSNQVLDKIKEEIAHKRAVLQKLKAKLNCSTENQDYNQFSQKLTDEIKLLIAETENYKSITNVWLLHNYLDKHQQILETIETSFEMQKRQVCNIGYNNLTVMANAFLAGLLRVVNAVGVTIQNTKNNTVEDITEQFKATILDQIQPLLEVKTVNDCSRLKGSLSALKVSKSILVTQGIFADQNIVPYYKEDLSTIETCLQRMETEIKEIERIQNFGK